MWFKIQFWILAWKCQTWKESTFMVSYYLCFYASFPPFLYPCFILLSLSVFCPFHMIICFLLISYTCFYFLPFPNFLLVVALYLPSRNLNFLIASFVGALQCLLHATSSWSSVFCFLSVLFLQLPLICVHILHQEVLLR